MKRYKKLVYSVCSQGVQSSVMMGGVNTRLVMSPCRVYLCLCDVGSGRARADCHPGRLQMEAKQHVCQLLRKTESSGAKLVVFVAYCCAQLKPNTAAIFDSAGAINLLMSCFPEGKLQSLLCTIVFSNR